MSTAVATPETTPITVGAVAPDFTLQDQDKKEFKLSDYKGKKAVALFFYPFDFSPTCTKENACFTTDFSRFGKYAEVAAISCDSTWTHKAYAEKMGYKHRLLADLHRKVSKDYGLFFAPANCSQRATVLIGKDGKVAWIHVEKNLGDERDYNSVEEALKKIA